MLFNGIFEERKSEEIFLMTMSLSGVKIFVTGTMVHRQSAASTSSDNL
jgi:hypothetical protein